LGSAGEYGGSCGLFAREIDGGLIQVSQFIYLCVANRLNFKGRRPVCVYHSILSEELAWRLLFVYSGLVAWLAPRSYEWNCTPASPSRLMMAAYPV